MMQDAEMPFKKKDRIKKNNVVKVDFREYQSNGEANNYYMDAEDLIFLGKKVLKSYLNEYNYVKYGDTVKKQSENESGHNNALNPTRGMGNMDDGYKKLIDRLDQDIREHKQEMRDRDARLQAEMREREERVHNEAKEREERIIAAISELKTDMNTNLSEIKTDVKATEKHVQNLVSQNFKNSIGTIIAIIAICVTIAVSIFVANKDTAPQINDSNKNVNSIQQNNDNVNNKNP